MKSALAVIGGLLLFAVIAVGGWHLGWWLEEEGTNRNTSIANDSLARQQAAMDSVQDKYRTATDIDVQITTATPEQAEALSAQRKAVVTQFCDDYGTLTGRLTISPAIEEFHYKECA